MVQKKQPGDYLCKAFDGYMGTMKEVTQKFEQDLDSLPKNVSTVKIGKSLFTCLGPRAVEMARVRGFKIFLDLKYLDIPNTVYEASYNATLLGVYMFNVHASGGKKMMKSALKGVEEALKNYPELTRPKVIAVTVLTSTSQEEMNIRGVLGTVEDQVLQLSHDALESGLDGVVCSPNELSMIRSDSHFPDNFLFVTPGIRPEWASTDDQARIMTPGEAILAGSNLLVMGRPLSTEDGTQKVLDEITKAFG